MKTQVINDEKIKADIYLAVRWLVKAAHATETKTGQPVNELSSEFIVGSREERWRLTITKINESTTAG